MEITSRRVMGGRVWAAALAAALGLAVAALALAGLTPAWADEPAESGYELGETVNAGTDNGFQGTVALRKGDPHFGWELGSFSVVGYESVEEGDVPTFVVAPGGAVTLRFRLDQDIEALNLDPALTVNRDENGRDAAYAVPEQDFGRGALIVARATAGGEAGEPEVTLDFLGSRAVHGQAVEVGTFGEGDYGVALDYELREDVLNLLGLSILPSFTDYRIAFSFNVRVDEGAEAVAGSGAPAAAPAAPADPAGAGEDAAENAPEETGMPAWQIGVMLVAILIGGLLVLRSELGSARRKG